MRQIACWQVMVHEPIHDFSGECVAFAVVAVTLRVRVHQRGRVNQQLKRRLMFAAACAQTNGSGQVATGTVAADGNAFGIHMQTVRMGSQPLKGGLRIVGERGPELEATGPSRIFDAQTTASMLRSGGASNEDVVTELRAMRVQLAQLQQEARRTADATNGNPEAPMLTEVVV